MSKQLTVTPNEDGRCIIHIFNQDYEISNELFENGVARLNLYGQEIEVTRVKTRKKKATPAEEPAPEEIPEESTNEPGDAPAEAEQPAEA